MAKHCNKDGSEMIGDLSNFIRDYSLLIGMDFHSERISCDFEDEKSGKLVFNVV